MAAGSAQRAAWDAYLALTVGLLPALDDEHDDDGLVNRRLGAVAIRIHRYAPIWAGDGPMLIAAVHSAIRLYRHGDRPALEGLLRVLAHRLYLLSAGRRVPNHPGRRNQQAP
jgi:hypothetical protein